ncbi:hypothetical protein DEU56DRAFT_817317 [Suillus clintonianus]|uniref:uncharacterized protein n=1 Tax=Suillus clintonianus TaxID=1904413 RepID=UPI001B85F482|nr:uncharacterized protein DEU56DRAFT_817317 [Suillus clintonianus]KAG2129484.1 hypothetical protein DEU56DRAFT_817317 [Suillus clintonianus]
MGDIQNRPFSKDYSGLINQSAIAVALVAVSVTSHEIMKRKRRGLHTQLEGLGSVESWEFGYGSRNPSPPTPRGWPLSWVKDSITFPQAKLNELRGIDAALYVRFLRGCLFFVLVHTFTTTPLLLPIHIHFSLDGVSPQSMTRASISSLVGTQQGRSLLWIHICLLFWITLTWMCNLFYICNGAFKLRAAKIEAAIRSVESDTLVEREAQYHPHPHPQYPFQDIPSLDTIHSNRGLRLRTVMVTNVPVQLRSEKELKEYFEYHLSRSLDMPSVGLPASTQPGFFNKLLAFGFNRAKRIPQNIGMSVREPANGSQEGGDGAPLGQVPSANRENVPPIDRVVIARRMTELASLLERREEILRRLEGAHISLAKKALLAVYGFEHRHGSREDITVPKRTRSADLERAYSPTHNGHQKNDTDLLVRTLSPFLVDYELTSKFAPSRRKLILKMKVDSEMESKDNTTPHETIWDALLSLPRGVLDPYQPLIHLSVFFRGKTVPSIDYYTAKLNLLTSLITQNRARAATEYDAVSTAFVTFEDPADARRACKYLAVHPNNPLACLVTMAPQYEDIDWTRVMKSTYRVDILKDWVVNIGVWGFTIFWLFPVSLFVGLVSIQSISTFWPSLYNYLSSHPWEEEVIQSFLPTLLLSLLAILIPPILLLIAKKAHTIITLSVMHDTIMTRYYKFLIVNVLVFFCVGTAALQSFLTSFKTVSGSGIINTVAGSFPTAGPFYVGWLIFTTAIHGGFEIVLCFAFHSYVDLALPLFTYPSTKRHVTPRKRAVGIRPRTFNFYYWLPNHLLVIHVLLLFALLNPLVIPFGLIYFSVETAVVKNQLLHVYAKNYECNGQILLIRILRYSLDGMMLLFAHPNAADFVFLAYMAVLRMTVNLALSAVLFVFTAMVKMIMTRMCRAKFEQDDTEEAQVICRMGARESEDSPESHIIPSDQPGSAQGVAVGADDHPSRFRTWRLPAWVNFSYSTVPRRFRQHERRKPNPFGPHARSFSRLNSVDENGKTPSTSTHEEPPATILGGPLHSPPAEQQPQPPARISTSLVQRHPPLAAWDDEPRHDIPYDNPYYTRPITNALWLPRNPLGLLDLDDTVDVYHALTSEPGSGDVGQWFGPGSSTSPMFQLPSSVPGDEQPSFFATGQYSGSEDIDLPEGIKSRIVTIDQEVDVESTRPRRPSLFSRHRSGSNVSMKSGDRASRGLPGRSQINDSNRPEFPHKSSSDHAPRSFRERASSYLPPPNLHFQSQFRDLDPGSRPDLHAQAEFARSTASIVRHGGSRVSLSHPINMTPQEVAATPREAVVTTREAVVTEAIAEEHLAMEERLRREHAAAGLNHGPTSRSWFTSWIYAKI